MPGYWNIGEALPFELRALLENGHIVPSRNGETRELSPRMITLNYPLERFHALPHRHANPAAQIAEALWVLSGRNDIGWLSYYLPRAKDYSDDGEHWTAGYGPRLRRWSSKDQVASWTGNEASDDGDAIDQIQWVISLLKLDPETRRAVVSLWDPAVDLCADGLDVPCNDWLAFLARQKVLNLSIAVRSNDAMWGWSGINTFEWSLLHELVANSAGMVLGTQTYFINSFHLYEYHYERAKKIVETASSAPPLYTANFDPIRLTSTLEEFDTAMERFWMVEDEMRASGWNNEKSAMNINEFHDPFLRQSLRMLRLYIARQQLAARDELERLANSMEADFRIVATEWLTRTPSLAPTAHLHVHPNGVAVTHLVTTLPNPPEPEPEYPDPADQPPAHTRSSVLGTLAALHAVKDAAYGDSWKKRGEVFSIIPNITRKVDRLERLAGGAPPTTDESLLDTVGDLAVYCIKYRGWLLDRLLGGDTVTGFLAAGKPLLSPVTYPQPATRPHCLDAIFHDHAELLETVTFRDHDKMLGLDRKAYLAGQMAAAAMDYLVLASDETPNAYAEWAGQWTLAATTEQEA